MAQRSKNVERPTSLVALRRAAEELVDVLLEIQPEDARAPAARRSLRKSANHLRLALEHALSVEVEPREEELVEVEPEELESSEEAPAAGTVDEPLFPDLQESLAGIVSERIAALQDQGEDAFGPHRSGHEAPGLHGHSRCLPVPELVNSLCANHRSGVLDVLFESEIITLWFASGDLVHAATNVALEGQRLGDRLVARGAITREALEEVIATSEPRGRVGEILLDSGAIDENDLAEALCEQSEDIFQRLSRDEHASYSYRDGLPDDFEEQIRLNVTQLLLESARLTDEERTIGSGARD